MILPLAEQDMSYRTKSQERGTLTLHNYMDFDDIQDFVRKEKENMQKIGMLLDNMMDQINNVPEYVPDNSDESFDIGKYV